jgi:ribonuclease E
LPAPMTFYEAAVEVLRKEGKPLHYEEITRRALEAGLLSHVGRVPDDIMRARLLAMARRDGGKDVALVEAGVFGLSEWGATQDESALDQTEVAPRIAEPPLRANERTPLTLAERRAAREAERGGKLEAEDREARQRGRRRRRRPRKSETNGDALHAIVRELGGGPIDLQYVVDSVLKQESLPEGFPEDIDGLKSLAEEENRLREEAESSPRFLLEGDRITLAPPPKAAAAAGPVAEAAEPVVRSDEAYAAASGQLLAALRDLAPEKLEAVLLELCGRHGLTDAKVAKRSAKGSPLFTGMARLGAVQLRVAVRMLLSARDVRPDDVDELREDLEHYSAAAGVVFSLGKIGRAARGRAEDMAKKPAILLDGESVARACAEARIGVRARLQEVVDVDPALLTAPAQGAG